MTDDPYIWIAASLCLLFSIGILWLGVEVANAPFLDEPQDDLPDTADAVHGEVE